MPKRLRAKCLIVGDSTTGKSALVQVFHSDNTQFPKNYSLTTGIDILTKSVLIPETHDSVELFLYDSSGKELYYEQAAEHFSNPSALMLVYDVTNESSFNSCAKWLERVRSQKPQVPFPAVLVANKTDLDQRRVIQPKEGRHFAEVNGLEYFECSAKEMQNVDQPFLYLAKSFHTLYEQKVDSFKNL